MRSLLVEFHQCHEWKVPGAIFFLTRRKGDRRSALWPRLDLPLRIPQTGKDGFEVVVFLGPN